MQWAQKGSIMVLSVNETMTLAFAAILLILGYRLKEKLTILEKYCIPAPVVGGFLFMFVTYIGHVTQSFTIEFKNIFQDTFMLAFFTTVGLGASLKLLKRGGVLLIGYWLICGFISLCQNTIGIAISRITGLESAYALLSSSISMIGGHGAALSYGKTFVEWGYPNGQLVGAAAATFGLISAVLIGGPLGRRLILVHDLKPDFTEEINEGVFHVNESENLERTHMDVIHNVTAILVCMALGSVISGLVGKVIELQFPTYVGAMFVAMFLRNINEAIHIYRFDFNLVDGIGNVMLNLYLSLALMTLKLWELSGLIGGVLLVVFAQVIFLAVFAYFVVFRLLGANYDAAVMCAGLCGHGLGATPSAIVNMTALNEKYGMSRKAMIIVPIVGAFLVDFIYQPGVIAFIKFFVPQLK